LLQEIRDELVKNDSSRPRAGKAAHPAP